MVSLSLDADRALAVLREVLRFDIRGQLGLNLTPETRIDSIAIDSLQMSEIILELEERLGVELDDDTLLKLSSAETIGDFLAGFGDTDAAPIGPATAKLQ